MLLGFALVARRSEIAALNVEDLADNARGLIVTIRSSKTDQGGAGQEIGVPMVAKDELSALRAVAAWRGSPVSAAGRSSPLSDSRDPESASWKATEAESMSEGLDASEMLE